MALRTQSTSRVEADHDFLLERFRTSDDHLVRRWVFGRLAAGSPLNVKPLIVAALGDSDRVIVSSALDILRQYPTQGTEFQLLRLFLNAEVSVKGLAAEALGAYITLWPSPAGRRAIEEYWDERHLLPPTFVMSLSRAMSALQPEFVVAYAQEAFSVLPAEKLASDAGFALASQVAGHLSESNSAEVLPFLLELSETHANGVLGLWRPLFNALGGSHYLDLVEDAFGEDISEWLQDVWEFCALDTFIQADEPLVPQAVLKSIDAAIESEQWATAARQLLLFLKTLRWPSQPLAIVECVRSVLCDQLPSCSFIDTSPRETFQVLAALLLGWMEAAHYPLNLDARLATCLAEREVAFRPEFERELLEHLVVSGTPTRHFQDVCTSLFEKGGFADSSKTAVTERFLRTLDESAPEKLAGYLPRIIAHDDTPQAVLELALEQFVERDLPLQGLQFPNTLDKEWSASMLNALTAAITEKAADFLVEQWDTFLSITPDDVAQTAALIGSRAFIEPVRTALQLTDSDAFIEPYVTLCALHEPDDVLAEELRRDLMSAEAAIHDVLSACERGECPCAKTQVRLHCGNCDHTFEHPTPRLIVDPETLDLHIVDAVTCPSCGHWEQTTLSYAERTPLLLRWYLQPHNREEVFRSTLASNPNDEPIRFCSLEIDGEFMGPRRAWQHLRDHLTDGQDNESMIPRQLLYGQLCMLLQRPDDAKTCLESVWSADESWVEAAYLLGTMAKQDGDPHGMLRYFRQVQSVTMAGHARWAITKPEYALRDVRGTLQALEMLPN